MRLPFEKHKDDSPSPKESGVTPNITSFSVERIEVTVYPNQSEEIEKIITEFQVHFIRSLAESYGIQCAHYVIFAPSEISGQIIDKLAHKIDTKQRIHVITHYKTESAISEFLKGLIIRYIKEGKESGKGVTSPIEGLVSKTDSFFARRKDIYIMILVATTVALVGLISNNVAVIIGAMLISPLMSPIASISLNSVLGRKSQINKSLYFAGQLITSSIMLAAVLAFLASLFMPIQITPEIQSRTEVSPILIVVAVMLGIAGGLAMLTSIPEIIVGVAIAVALVPPATVIGIGLGLGMIEVAFYSFLVLTSNIIGMIIGFKVIFLIKGISPRKYYEKQRAKEVTRVNILVLAGLAVTLGVIEILFA